MGFENRIFISAEQFAMSRSYSHSRVDAAAGGRAASAGGVTFGDNHVRQFDSSDAPDQFDDPDDEQLQEQDHDAMLPEIPPVDVSEGLSDELNLSSWIVNHGIRMINTVVTQATNLDPNQIARALRDHVRFHGKKKNLHMKQYMKRTINRLMKLSTSFDAEHPANLVTLLSLGYDEREAIKILEFFNGSGLKPFSSQGSLGPCDRMCWFWIFVNLNMRTDMFSECENPLQMFKLYATNPSQYQLPQQYQSVAQEALSHFQSQVSSSASHEQGQALGSSCAASVAGSDFSAMTETGGFLSKFHAAFTALSKLFNEWLTGNDHLRNESAGLSEEALIEIAFRLLEKMQCSKTGKFGTDRAFSDQIYSKLIEAYRNEQRKGTRFVLRLRETFSSILCATGNYDAAIEWLNRALQCQHPRKGNLTRAEVAVLNFAFISMSLGVQSLASCTSENLRALFAHIFDGAELEVDESEAPKFLSAIDRVAADFAIKRKIEAKPVSTEAVSAVSAVSEAPNGGLRTRGGPPRGRGGAVAGGGQTHRASQDARSAEFDAMMRAAAADPEKRAQMLKWLSESN